MSERIGIDRLLRIMRESHDHEHRTDMVQVPAGVLARMLHVATYLDCPVELTAMEIEGFRTLLDQGEDILVGPWFRRFGHDYRKAVAEDMETLLAALTNGGAAHAQGGPLAPSAPAPAPGGGPATGDGEQGDQGPGAGGRGDPGTAP